jgi:hypothetical protein
VKKHKIMVIEDSHARNCAAELQNSLGVAFELSSFVKPGAGLSVITDTAKEETENVNNEDVVLWAGDNDVSKNNSKDTMKHICNFVEKRRKTNIVIVNISH